MLARRAWSQNRTVFGTVLAPLRRLAQLVNVEPTWAGMWDTNEARPCGFLDCPNLIEEPAFDWSMCDACHETADDGPLDGSW